MGPARWRRRAPGILLGTLVVLLVALVIGVGRSVTAPSAAPLSTVHVLNYPNLNSSGWPATVDPAVVTDSSSIQVLSLLYANLVRLDSHNRAVPDLARSWDLSADRRTYTFHLRRDARFSDGKPITAADVAYSLRRALGPRALTGQSPSPVALTYLGHIRGAAAYSAGKARALRGVTALDAHTVRIAIDRPLPSFLPMLSYPTGAVVERGTPPGALVTGDPMRRQVSSGPFRVVAFRRGSSLTFAPNPGYYAHKRMKLRRVEMPFVRDHRTMYQGYESGQYAMTTVPAERLTSARGRSDTHSSPILAIDYIVYNVAMPPFSNRALRLATSYAIDRDAINKDVLHGAHSTIYSVVPQGLPGYDARGKGAVPGYDPARARRYLALARRQMGKNFPSALTISYASDVPGAEQEYVALQDQWRRIGLNVHIRRVPLNVWLGSLVKPTSSLAFRGGEPWVQGVWGADYPDPEDFTTALLSPSSTHNVGNYANPRFAALLDVARGATGNARARLYVEAGRMALNDAAWAMIGQVTVTYRWSARITGLAVWSSNITASPQPRDNDWTNVDVQ